MNAEVLAAIAKLMEALAATVEVTDVVYLDGELTVRDNDTVFGVVRWVDDFLLFDPAPEAT